MAKQRNFFVVVFVIVTSATTHVHSDAQQPPDMEMCKKQLYDRLVAENKVLTALAMRFSEDIPYECRKLQAEWIRSSQLESTDYFPTIEADQMYRERLVASEQESPRSQSDILMSDGVAAKYISKGYEPPKGSVTEVRGYTTLSGAE